MKPLISSKNKLFLLFTLIIVSINSVALANEEKTKLFSISQKQETENNSSEDNLNSTILPLPPQTGTPEDNTAPGGTREDPIIANNCSQNSLTVSYLLGEQMRHDTISTYPVFWFCLPNTKDNPLNLEFTLTEAESDRLIYQKTLQVKEEAGILGISIPEKIEYALNTNINYSWQLKVKNSNHNSPKMLTGWVRRVPISNDLKSQLENNNLPAYEVYLQHNILYDALTDLAQNYQSEPNNSQIRAAWQNLLTDLGW